MKKKVMLSLITFFLILSIKTYAVSDLKLVEKYFIEKGVVSIVDMMGGNLKEGTTALYMDSTKDGGFIAAGEYIKTIDSKIDQDIWICKFDRYGVKEWEQIYGGTRRDSAYTIEETKDGGYIVGGTSLSEDGHMKPYYLEFSKNTATPYMFALKLDAQGNIVNGNSFGSYMEDTLFSLKATSDGGYILSGKTGASTTSDKIRNYKDIPSEETYNVYAQWIIKLKADLKPEWQTFVGFLASDYAKTTKVYDIVEDVDGGFVMLGNLMSDDKNTYNIVKISNKGKIIWKKSLSNSYSKDDIVRVYKIKRLSDGNFAFLGSIFTPLYSDSIYKADDSDIFLGKFNSNGDILWETRFGKGDDDLGYSLCETDKELLVTGTIRQPLWQNEKSYENFHKNPNVDMDTSTDIAVLRVNKVDGSLLSYNCYGGTGFDYVGDSAYFEIIKTSTKVDLGNFINVMDDGTIRILGKTNGSNDYDLEGLNASKKNGMVILYLKDSIVAEEGINNFRDYGNYAAFVEVKRQFTIRFTKNLNTSMVNENNVFVSTDPKGINKVTSMSNLQISGKEIKVSSPASGYSPNTTYYLFVINTLQSEQGTKLVNNIRMTFITK